MLKSRNISYCWHIDLNRHQLLFWMAKIWTATEVEYRKTCANKDVRNTEQNDDRLPGNNYRTVHKLGIQPLRQLRKSFSVLLVWRHQPCLWI